MKKEALEISKTLPLPLDWVTQRTAVLAMSGAGKSNAARAIAEEFFAAKLPFVAVDPKGDWWGLRAGRDGSPKGGIDVAIFGGKHGDVPLERDGGRLVADLVVRQRLSCILDLSEFESDEDKNRFLLEFATRLYRTNEDPLHLFLDEADETVPQVPVKDQVRLLRIFEFIVRKGRTKGLGVTMLSQRSALLNKNVLTQIETLFAMRTTGPQDIAAIEGWMKNHGGDRAMLATLATLGDGEAWVWSPRYLGKMERIRFRLSHTYDSGATPKNYQANQKRKPATLSDVNVKALREAMSATIERSAQEDPELLRARIVELEKELRSRGTGERVPGAGKKSDPDPGTRHPAPDSRPWREWVGRLRAELEFEQRRSDAALRRSEEVETHCQQLYQHLDQLERWKAQRPRPWTVPRMTAVELDALAKTKMPDAVAEVRLGIGVRGTGAGVRPEQKSESKAAVVPPGASTAGIAKTNGLAAAVPSPSSPSPPSPLSSTNPDPGSRPPASSLGKGELAVLGALHHLGPLPTLRLAVVCGYRNGKAFRNLLSAMRTRGLVENLDRDVLTLTEQGGDAARGLPQPMHGPELVQFWEQKMSKSAGLAFRYLVDNVLESNGTAPVEEIAAATGYKMGKAFLNSISELRGWGLAEGRRDALGLSEAREDFS